MLVGIWGYYEELCKNGYLLKHADTGIGSDLLKPINQLFQHFLDRNVTVKSLDMINDIENMDAVIFLDYPKLSTKVVKKVFDLDVPKYLVSFESKLIRPENWDLQKHKAFKKIFTWNDDFVDNKKYFKINFAHQFPTEILKDLGLKKKLCTLIAGNKKVAHPLELYSKRVEIIRWFGKNHFEDFDFYGMGWDEYRSSNKYLNFGLRKLGVTRWLAPKYPSYCGSVTSKKEVLQKYKFSICYENAQDIPGYITEKIFDCFFAGCVPVYWGANNINDHIPTSCFIDMRDFSNYEEMYQSMKSMTDTEYLGYLDAIELFLHSERAFQFTIDFFANTIVKHICEKNEI